MSEWSKEQTEDIREVDKKKKPAANAPFKEEDRRRDEDTLPGEEKGSAGEHEQEPDKDKEAAP